MFTHTQQVLTFMPVPVPTLFNQLIAEMPNVLGLVSRQSSARGAGEAPGGTGPSRSGTPLSQRTNSLRGEREGSRRGQASPMPQQPEEKYIVYLRFPFERNGFVDPPQVCAPPGSGAGRYFNQELRSTGTPQRKDTSGDIFLGVTEIPTLIV